MVGLLNWLVQGLLVAGAAAVGLRVIPASRAHARYLFIWAAYLLVLVLPALPLVSTGAIDPQVVDRASSPVAPVLTMPAAWWTSPAVMMGLWIIWSGIHAVRLVMDAAATRQATRHGRPCPDDALARLPRWSQVRETGRPTRVILSNGVRFAAVLGCGSPVIALEPGILTQLSANDLDRVLVHEWAHVQRRDDVAQIVQRVIRAVVGWHPAAWWLERQLEFEREAACDEVAVAVTGSAKEYATCLATLAALAQPRGRRLPALAVASSSGLRRRLVRILSSPSAGGGRPWRLATVSAGVALAALGFAVSNLRAVESATTWSAPPAAMQPAFAEAAANAPSATSVAVVPAASQAARSAPSAAIQSNRDARPAAAAASDAPTDVAATRATEIPPTAGTPSEGTLSSGTRSSGTPSAPLPSTQWTMATPDSAPVTTDTPRHADESAPAPWAIAANAGVAIGRSSQNAGQAAAGFFTRFGKGIARTH